MKKRSLAEQSKQATNQVRAIWSQINVATEAAVSATAKGTQRVEFGVELADRAGETIMLTGTINDAAHAGEQIAASAKLESEGMVQVAGGMHDTTKETRAVIGRAERGFASASASNALARELKDLAAGNG